MIKIGIVDDHTLFRAGLTRLVNSFNDCQVIFQAGNGQELLNKLSEKEDVELILLDLKMPVMGGLEALEKLKPTYKDLKVLVISMHDDIPFVVQAMKKGANGYILKDIDADELNTAINKVMDLGFYVNDKLSKVLIHGLTTDEGKKKRNIKLNEALTDIEQEILELICQGLTSQEIADKIFRSRRTIEGHKQRLLDKTNTKNTPALVAWAFRHGIVE
ncbi:MAG: response regulator transcription factor [Saprospiraceae bacterium]|nr:response regulator transcription factor [Saprospiraceae bacterium]